MRRYLSFLLVFSILFFVLFLTANFQSSATGNAGYIGAEKCSACHEQIYYHYSKSIHNKKEISWSPANKEGCEACHGPGAEHVEKGGGKGVGIFVFSKETDAKCRSKKCLSCHEETKALALWDMNRHNTEDVACNDCHSIHSAQGPKFLKIYEPYLCFDCHRDIRAKMNKQSHHPVREGRMKCSDCHDPMGTFSTLPVSSYSAYDSFGSNKIIKADSVNDLCYKCHAEKRGPQVFAHPPVEESCLICHQVHGSNHSMLLDKKVPQLCQNCHSVGKDNPFIRSMTQVPFNKQHGFSGSTPSNRFYARACLNCHTNIHGSNRNPMWLR